MAETIKALIGWGGDWSVGIPDQGIEVDTGLYDIEPEEREAFRAAFKQLYDYVSGEKCGVEFSDECPDCGVVGEHKCSALPC